MPTNAAPASRWASRRARRDAREDGTPLVQPGVYLLTSAASPQFRSPITVRVIRERSDRHTYAGWAWIEAYQLDTAGDATAHRELFVMPAGMRPVPVPAAPAVRRGVTPTRQVPAGSADRRCHG